MPDHDFRPDEIDRKIIAALQENGRVSFKHIGRNLNIADSTVRFRTERMVKSGFLRITAVVDPLFSENSILALVGIKLQKGNHVNLNRRILEIPGVKSVSNCTGSFDLLVEVFAENREGLRRILVEDMPKLDVIAVTETFIYLETLNKWVPYI
jgi:Lrp/AsnC family transcriptional regulator for asnA, asnC and gidA